VSTIDNNETKYTAILSEYGSLYVFLSVGIVANKSIHVSNIIE